MTTVTQEPIDLDRLEEDAQARRAELREARQRLSPEALSDSTVVAELVSIESELKACEQALERVNLARTEQGRREAAARQQAEAERRERALDRARELQVERKEAARAVDSALRRFAVALKAWDASTSAQEQALRQAGRDGTVARARRWMIESALRKALNDAKLPHGIIDLPPASAKARPLAECDARPVEPKGASDE